MENIVKIVYDKSINNKFLNLNDMEKILIFLVANKQLNSYISTISIMPTISENVAFYSECDKKITIYSTTLERVLKNIDKNILTASGFEKKLYQNMLILQVLLHEVEHANQYKISYRDNTIESFIIRIANLVNEADKLYDFSPTERLAEIKSFKELITSLKFIRGKLQKLYELLEMEKLQRLIRGYHYNNPNKEVSSPLIAYFTIGNKRHLLNSFSWYEDSFLNLSQQVYLDYKLEERLLYGFPITVDEYLYCMKPLLVSLNNNFKNRTNYVFESKKFVKGDDLKDESKTK